MELPKKETWLIDLTNIRKRVNWLIIKLFPMCDFDKLAKARNSQHKKGVRTKHESLFAETCKNNSGYKFASHNGLRWRKGLPTTVAYLLDRIPSVSWGILGFKYPALTSLISFTVLPVITIWGFTIATVLVLLWIPFPLNILSAGGVLSPLELVSLGQQWQRFKVQWKLITRPSQRQKPKSIQESVEDYIKTIKTK